MPKIPRFFQQPRRPASRASPTVGVNIPANQVASLTVSDGYRGKVLQEAGKKLPGQIKKITDVIDSNYITNSLTELQLEAADAYEGMKTSPTFKQDFEKYLRGRSEAVIAEAPSADAREVLSRQLSTLSGSYDSQLRRDTDAVNKSSNLMRTNNTISRLVSFANSQPEQLGLIESHLDALGEQLQRDGLSAEQAMTVVGTAKQRASSSSLGALLSKNPGQAKVLIDSLDADEEVKARLDRVASDNLETQFVGQINNETKAEVAQIERTASQEEDALLALYSDQAVENPRELLTQLSEKDREDFAKFVGGGSKPKGLQSFSSNVIANALNIEQVETELDQLKTQRRKGLISGQEYAIASQSIQAEYDSLKDPVYRSLKEILVNELGSDISEKNKLMAINTLKNNTPTPENTLNLARTTKQIEGLEIRSQFRANNTPLDLTDLNNAKTQISELLRTNQLKRRDAYLQLRSINKLQQLEDN